MKPRILFLVPAEYDALRNKGVDWMIRERDEEGFFERVVTVHPLAGQVRIIDINTVHRIYELDLGTGVRSILGVVQAFRRVVGIALDERVDLVRATDPYLMGLMAWWISRVLAVPFCVSVHADYQQIFSLNPKNMRGRLRRLVASMLPPFVLKRAGMVMPIREHLVPVLEAAGARRATIRLIPHGVDLERFSSPPMLDARVAFQIPDGKKIISVACRLSPENYVRDIAAVIARIAARRRDVVFVILGEGTEEHVLHGLVAADPAIAAAVRLFPFQSIDGVIALRRVSDVSLCLMGGFSLIEACAAGSPVVAYDVAWHRELVREGDTGCLVAEHDVDAAVAAITGLLDDPTGAAAMAARARQLVLARHDVRHTSRIKREIYADLLAAAPHETARS